MKAFGRLASAAVVATFVLIILGGLVRATGAGLACPDWPLCHGRLIPPLDPLVLTEWSHRFVASILGILTLAVALADWPLCYGQLLPSLTGGVGAHLLHRFAAAIAGALIVVTAAAAYRTQTRRPQLQAASAIAVGLLILQIILGALNIEYRLADAVTIAHLATAAALFATLVVLAVLSSRLPELEAYRPEAAGRPGRCRVQRVMDYVALTKPRIIVLLLVTAFASMLIAAPGRISPWLIFFTLAGGAMSAGSANAINQVLERDIDALMSRTRRRPIPAGRVSPPYAFAFAVLLGTVAFVEMAVLVNLLAAVLSLPALLLYVFVYTVWLKRSTPQNIVIGGVAGAVPPLVGWSAATGHLSLTAILLFVIVFLWTPPHFWALALFRRDDYARARVPMLPVVAGETENRRQIVIYTVVLVLVTFLLYPVARLGPVYLLSAGFLGAAFVMLAVRLQRQQTTAAAVRVFGYSIFYLGLLFAAMVADRLLQA